MKRDLDLIRTILLELEESNFIGEIEGYAPENITHHLYLLEDAGLITQELYTNMYTQGCILDGIRMTWSGYEFLEASRSNTTWAKAKEMLLEKTGAMTFELCKTLLVQLAKNALENCAT